MTKDADLIESITIKNHQLERELEAAREEVRKQRKGLQMQRMQHQDGTKRLTGQITTLKGELAMCHQKLRLLGKRPAPADPEEVEYLKEAVCWEIKRRRKQSTC